MKIPAVGEYRRNRGKGGRLEIAVLCRRFMKISAMENINRNPTRKDRIKI